MAKNPAFLFYTDNFMGGTMFFTDEQVGQYIRLLCAEHHTGHLSKEQMIRFCGGKEDKMIFEKFSIDADGRYFNERLEAEIAKRDNFSGSRSNNSSKGWEKRRNGNGSDVKTERFKPPTVQQVIEFFKEKGFNEMLAKTAFDHYDLAGWKDSHGSPVKNWKSKMNTNWLKEKNRAEYGLSENNTAQTILKTPKFIS